MFNKALKSYQKLNLIVSKVNLTLRLPKQFKLNSLLAVKLGRFVYKGVLSDKQVIFKITNKRQIFELQDESKKLSDVNKRLANTELENLIPKPLDIGISYGAAYYIESCLEGASNQIINNSPLQQAISFTTKLSNYQLQKNDEYIVNILNNSVFKTHEKYKDFFILMSKRLSGKTTHVTCFQHGDFWANNILFKKGSLTGVVDWEEANIYFVGYDLIHLLVMNENNLNSRESGDVIIQFMFSTPSEFNKQLELFYASLNIKFPDVEVLMLIYWLVFISNSHQQKEIEKRSEKWKRSNIELPIKNMMSKWGL